LDHSLSGARDGARQPTRRGRTVALARAVARLAVALRAVGRRRSPARTGLVFLAVLLLGAALIVPGLGAPQLRGGNEAVEALAVQQMVRDGALLFPTLNAEHPVYKPPLFHWTAAALAGALRVSTVSETTVRLPSVLYGLAGVLLTMLFVAHWRTLPDAVLAGALMLASYQYVRAARLGRVDMTLAFFETAALLSLLLALGSAWYVACLFGHPDILDRQLADENLGRFFGRLGTMEPWYYAWPLVSASLPLNLLVPLAVVADCARHASPRPHPGATEIRRGCWRSSGASRCWCSRWPPTSGAATSCRWCRLRRCWSSTGSPRARRAGATSHTAR